MRQYSETYHVLELRKLVAEGLYDTWHRPCDGMFRPAELLAYQGRLIEAIEAAEKIQIEKYGHMLGHEFRCLTKTTTVTILNGPMEDSRLAIVR
jgi:hypothetical protein